MKLTNVARASPGELCGDYEVTLIDPGELPWSSDSPEAKSVNATSRDPSPFAGDMIHGSAKHELAQRGKYACWLDPEDPRAVANAMHLSIGRALNMLKSQIAARGKAFEETGGLSERLRVRPQFHGAEPSRPGCAGLLASRR